MSKSYDGKEICIYFGTLQEIQDSTTCHRDDCFMYDICTGEKKEPLKIIPKKVEEPEIQPYTTVKILTDNYKGKIGFVEVVYPYDVMLEGSKVYMIRFKENHKGMFKREEFEVIS